MKIWLDDKDGNRWSATRPYEDADHVLTEMDCPGCGEKVRAQGGGMHIESHDTYAASARCACGESVGTLRVEMSTLFGLEEDEAVTKHGRARVYG